MRLSNVVGRSWDPWRELNQLHREMDRLLSTRRPGLGLGAGPREYPPVNIYTKDQDLMLTTEVPGIDPSKLDITVTGDSLTIRGEREADLLGENETYHRRERPVGAFTRTVELPFEVDPDKVDASYELGVLVIRLTRPEEMKPKKVAVKTA